MNFQEVMNIIKEKNQEKKLELINKDELFSELNFWDKKKLIESLDDNNKYKLLHNEVFIKRLTENNGFSVFELNNLIQTLGDDYLYKLLSDKDYTLNILKLESYNITLLLKKIEDENYKLELFDIYVELIFYQNTEIIISFSDETKIDLVLNGKGKIVERMRRFDIVSIFSSIKNTDLLIGLFKNNREFFENKGIFPYEIVRNLKANEQKRKFIERLKEADLTPKEEKEIIVSMPEELKNQTELFSENYRYLLDIPLIEMDVVKKIMPDLSKDIEIYKDLDELIRLDPENYTEEEKKGKLMELCRMCPNCEVISRSFGAMLFKSKGEDYTKAEPWITSVLNKLGNKNYTDLQKLAIIDNEIGKKIGYSPDFGTEVFDGNDSRKIWKIIDNGFGVCNGIADVERYILERVGIKSEIVSSGGHAFLLLKDFEVQTSDGQVKKVNTIMDPTWNLSSHRFGALPGNFCKGYNEIRKNDIDKDGKDHESHKNDEKLLIATFNLEEKDLREAFKSVGLTLEDGSFPIKTWIDESDKIAEIYKNDLEENLKRQFELFERFYPDFTACPNESMKVMHDIILDSEKINFNQAIINKVYEKTDKNKEPVVYIYVQSDEIGEKFYVVDKQTKKIIESSRLDFTKRFECYDTDLDKNKGIRPWDSSNGVKTLADENKDVASDGR